MAQECIEYSVGGDIRKMVVVDGQPFYCSTGDNSGMPGRWLPFIMLQGTKDNNYQSLPDIYDQFMFEARLKVSQLHDSVFSDPQYIIKSGEAYIDDFVEDRVKCEKMANRMPLKRFLIASSRLDVRHYTDEELTTAGLSPDECKLARTPIILAEKPQHVSSDPDFINFWLASKGAYYIHQITHFPAEALERERRSLDEEKHPKASINNPITLREASTLLQDYIKGGSWLKLLFSGHIRRKHVDEVKAVLHKRPAPASAGELAQSIREEIRRSEHSLKADGSLERILLTIESRSQLSQVMATASQPTKSSSSRSRCVFFQPVSGSEESVDRSIVPLSADLELTTPFSAVPAAAPSHG